jgi:hypothetical protein
VLTRWRRKKSSPARASHGSSIPSRAPAHDRLRERIDEEGREIDALAQVEIHVGFLERGEAREPLAKAQEVLPVLAGVVVFDGGEVFGRHALMRRP